MWSRLSSDFPLSEMPYTATLSGALIYTDAQVLCQMIGKDKAKELRESGHINVLIPDDELISLFSVDIDTKPKLDFQKRSDVYMAYLWAIYVDSLTGDYWPIYEYGNIANPSSRNLIENMLLNRISFYKKTVWKENMQKPSDRRFKLGLAVDDRTYVRICEKFGEVKHHDTRKLLLERVREGISV